MHVSEIASLISSQLKAAPHACTSACDMMQMKIEVHAHGGKHHVRWSRHTTQPWMSPETLVRKVYSIYVCKASRKVHHCHCACDGEKITNQDNYLVCRLTGLQWENETEEVQSWKLASKCVPTVTHDKRDPNLFNRTKDGHIKSIDAVNLNTSFYQSTCRDILEKLVFSDTRMQLEMQKYRESSDEALKVLGKYIRHCQNRKTIKRFSDMRSIYLNMTRKKPVYYTRLQKYKRYEKRILRKYSDLVIKYWNFIQKTPLAVEKPTCFPFQTFVVSCLYLMKRGIRDIIPQEIELECLLPEANSLDMYGILKPAFTQVKNYIIKAIRTK